MLIRRRIGNCLSALVVGGALLAGAVLAQGADTKTLEGTISNTHCGMKHGIADAKACNKGCISKGAKYALVVNDKVYELEGKTADIEKLSGAKAKVSGTVDGMKIQVSSVSPAS